MQRTIDDITKFIIPEQFGTDEDEYGDTLRSVIDQVLNIGCEFAYGISKFVIMLNDTEVVKIPFNGEFYWDNDSQGYDAFEEFKSTIDYCRVEADYYKEAVKWGIAEFFAGTRFVGYTKDHTPFYVSERVHKTLDDVWYSVSEESVQTARDYANSKENFYWRRLSDHWLAVALEKYGKEKVDKFLEFLQAYDIDDLHQGNVGFREDGTPCLIDYSGWNENDC